MYTNTLKRAKIIFAYKSGVAKITLVSTYVQVVYPEIAAAFSASLHKCEK